MYSFIPYWVLSTHKNVKCYPTMTKIRIGFGGCIILYLSLGIKIAQKPYIVWSLGPKASIHESLDP